MSRDDAHRGGHRSRGEPGGHRAPDVLVIDEGRGSVGEPISTPSIVERGGEQVGERAASRSPGSTPMCGAPSGSWSRPWIGPARRSAGARSGLCPACSSTRSITWTASCSSDRAPDKVTRDRLKRQIKREGFPRAACAGGRGQALIVRAVPGSAWGVACRSPRLPPCACCSTALRAFALAHVPGAPARSAPRAWPR